MISVRRAGEEDAELLAELYGFVHDPHLDRRPERFKPTDPGEVAEWFRSRLRKPTVRAWIAESEGAAIGYVLATTYDRAETPFRYPRVICQMDQLAVTPEFRRRGVARKLIDRVLADARARGIQDVEGNSWYFNTAAHDMLRAFGFDIQILRFSRTISEAPPT